MPNNFETESKVDGKGTKSAAFEPSHDPSTSPARTPDLVGTHGDAPKSTPDLVGAHGDAPKKKRGPKTARDKQRVSRNAIKHAILSPHPVVIAGLETVEEWEEFKSEIVESWAPEGGYERDVAGDIAFGLWRLQRCRVYESAVLSRQVEEVEAELQYSDAAEGAEVSEGGALEDEREQRDLPEIEPARLRAHQHLNVIPNGWHIDRILRYETHVRRALLQTVHELEARQAHRKGERTPLARVDFTAGPSLRLPSASGSSSLQQVNQDLARTERDLAARRRARSPEGKPAVTRADG